MARRAQAAAVLAGVLAAATTACDGSIFVPENVVPPAQRLHRLNRLEYNNTVHDLLGTELRPADAFPPDGESDGLDNMAATLQLTPSLLDGYYSAARLVVDDALDEHPAFEVTRHHDELGVAGGYPVGNLWALSGNAVVVAIDVPAGGATITLVAGASQIGPAPAPQVSLDIDGATIQTFPVQGTAAAPAAHVATVAFEAGAHTVRYAPTNFVNDAVANTSNNVLVYSLSIESDARVEGPGRARVFACDPTSAADPAGCYRDIVARFATRAWRRPLADDETAALHRLFDDLRAGGEDDEQALRLVLRAILTSPKFIYRSRSTLDADSWQWLDDYVLASRLSYALWSSTPDDRLLAAAADGALSSEQALAETVAWMIADDKSRGLLDGFAEQWLSTRQLANATPSPDVFPTFDEALRRDMVAESKHFFADYLHNGQPVVTMLAPDFAYLNDRLAAHYGLAPVASEQLIRVAATDTKRAGILSLSAWLTANSHAEHSSPIRRGHWVSDRILCEPVPPPPPGLNIEPIDTSGDVPLREQLERHRGNPVCASCHSHLDVLGMGFEEYDGIGRARTEPDVDMLGELPDGRTFEGAAELAALVDPRTFAHCVTTKLFAYSMGRSVQADDLEYIDAIADRAVAEGLTLPELLVAIVTTPAFRSPGPLQGDTP